MSYLKKNWKKIILSFFVLTFSYVISQNFPVPKIEPDETITSRIIFVPGIKTWDFYLTGWKRDLPQKFPNAEIVFLDDIFYLHFENEKTEEIIKNGVKILNDGKPTRIIAHSFGGILARGMIDRSPNANIEKFITMASPHQMKIFGVDSAKKFLQIPNLIPEKINTKTFGGYFDWMVPCVWTRLNNFDHQNILSEHLGFLLFKKIRAKILEEVRSL